MTIARRTWGLLVAVCLVAPQILRAQLGGQFEYPLSVVVDRSGNVLVSENQRNRIGFYGPNGVIVWRKGTLGTGDGEFRTRPASLWINWGLCMSPTTATPACRSSTRRRAPS